MTTPLVEAVQRLRAADEAVARQDWPTPLRMGDVRVVLDELDRLTAQVARLVPTKKKPREETVETVVRLTDHTKVALVAAECPGGCVTWMKCLSTRRPDKTTVRRRWECPRCTGRFTSYDKEEAKA